MANCSRIAEPRDVPPQDRARRASGTCEISGFARQPLAEQRRGPLLHLAGGLVGERDRQNAAGRRAVADQLGDAIRDDARLAGAGAGQHQQRPAERVHRFALRGVQIVRHGHPANICGGIQAGASSSSPARRIGGRSTG